MLFSTTYVTDTTVIFLTLRLRFKKKPKVILMFCNAKAGILSNLFQSHSFNSERPGGREMSAVIVTDDYLCYS